MRHAELGGDGEVPERKVMRNSQWGKEGACASGGCVKTVPLKVFPPGEPGCGRRTHPRPIRDRPPPLLSTAGAEGREGVMPAAGQRGLRGQVALPPLFPFGCRRTHPRPIRDRPPPLLSTAGAEGREGVMPAAGQRGLRGQVALPPLFPFDCKQHKRGGARLPF